MNEQKNELTKLTMMFVEFSEKMQKICKLNQQNKWNYYSTEYMEYMIENCRNYFANIRIDTEKLTDITLSYAKDYSQLLENAFSQWSKVKKSIIEIVENDKRFKNKLWTEHFLFNFFKQFYLLINHYIPQIIDSFKGIDDHDKEKLLFYTKQFMDAIAPSNFFLTNPYILQETLNSKGENFIKGLNNFIEDIERGNGKIQIKMTDYEAFKVGKNIAATPGKIIFQNDLMQLIQYEPQTKKVYKKPLLIIPPWINKYYILDLSPENSLVNWLVNQGYTVFILSWINPNESHAHKNFEDYMYEGPLVALDMIEKSIGEKVVNAVGYCIGGTLLASTLAYLTHHKKERIASATYLATMLDFSNPGNLGVFLDEIQIQYLEKYIEKQGYLDGYMLSQAFNMLRSNDLIWSYFVKNYLAGEKPLPLDILYWNSDSTNLPKTMVNFYLRNMYLHNRLVKPNGIQLLNTPINLGAIQTPAYFLSAEQDHIAPWQSTYLGRTIHGGPTTFVLGGSGHIAGIINPPSKSKYFYYTNEMINQHTMKAAYFLETAKKNEGSWWIHWENWLRQNSGKQIKAQKVEWGKLPIIETAPGSYVK